MKKVSKVIALLISLTIIASLFVGCGKKQEGTVNSGGSNNTAAAGPDWKKDTSPVTITWFVDQDWYKKNWDTKNCLLDKMITDETGVSIKFTSGNADKLSAMIASGEIPDVVTAWYTLPQAKMLQQSGMVWPLDELIQKYAPNFKIPESMKKWHAQEDGKLYGIVNYFYAPEKLKQGEHVPTHAELRARKDIMDKLGIKPEDFNTKAGTIEALKKVRDAKLKFNGFDVVPAYFDYNILMQFFGARREDENGNYVNRDYEPEALEALKFMNKLYNEGLLGKDVLTLNQQQRKERVGQGRVFAYTGHLTDNDAALYNLDKNAIFVHVGPIKGDAGKKTYLDPSPMAGWTISMISKKAKRPDRIIQLFEYLYSSDEMQLNMQFGPKGAAWNYDDKGHVKYTEQYNKDKAADPAKATLKYGDNTLPWLIDWIPIQRAWPQPTNPADAASLESDTYFSQFTYTDFAFSVLDPPGGTDEAAIKAKIDEYHNKQIAKIIMAPESKVDELFKEMIAQEKKLGYDKLYAWQNEQFKKAKEKLGVKFAWPANQK